MKLLSLFALMSFFSIHIQALSIVEKQKCKLVAPTDGAIFFKGTVKATKAITAEDCVRKVAPFSPSGQVLKIKFAGSSIAVIDGAPRIQGYLNLKDRNCLLISHSQGPILSENYIVASGNAQTKEQCIAAITPESRGIMQVLSVYYNGNRAALVELGSVLGN